MPDSPVRISILSSTSEIPKHAEATRKPLSNVSGSRNVINLDQRISPHIHEKSRRVLEMCRNRVKNQAIHSSAIMRSAGFEYTNNGNATRCHTCELEVSGWTANMIPSAIHSQRSPTCAFVLSTLRSEKTITYPTINLIQTSSTSDDRDQPLKRLKVGTASATCLPNTLIEVESLKQVRKRTFSHWPHRSSPSSSQMIEAGFFNCNVGDRVICIYCNIICQQWTPNSDDPCEVHKTLSPKCPYVIAMLTRPQISSISIINEASTSVDQYQCHAIVYTAACNTNYIEIPKRIASFATWPNENLPSVDDLVKAGFFFTGTKTIVTCFYCNGSLQNWGANDNPTIEHARWFPHCAYAKQLCGAELHRKIQESKRAQQERTRTNDASNQSGVSANNLNDGRLVIPDESTLSRIVAARLDLPISQRLLDRNFKLSIIKRCWEDQLRIKHDDFVSDCDLFMACTVLQKQIEHIDGKKENITVPSVAMKRIREKEQADSLSRNRITVNVCVNDIVEIHAREQAASASSQINSSDGNTIEMTTSSESDTSEISTTASVSVRKEMATPKPSSMEKVAGNCGHSSLPTNPCVVCFKEEKRLACIPCGHLATCVPCGQSVRSCPICRRSIDAFVRIYL